MSEVKIESIEYKSHWLVSVTEPHFDEYRRLGPCSWFLEIGWGSWEPVYDCEELEKAFQKHLKVWSPV